MKLIRRMLVYSFVLFMGLGILYLSVLFTDVNLISKVFFGISGVFHIFIWCYFYFVKFRPLIKLVDDAQRKQGQ